MAQQGVVRKSEEGHFDSPVGVVLGGVHLRDNASWASTRSVMRLQRSPANAKAWSIARSTSEDRASRSRPLARKKRVRTVATGIERLSATSSTLISSTARSTNTVRNAS